jgi:two-component system KDP operon response regulator KdpE
MNSPNILFVEDDPNVASALAKALVSEGFAVRHAGNAERALALFEQSQPDLVLLDLGLPDRGGGDVFERITGLDPFVSIVIVTARPGQIELAREAGVAALVEKPADIDRLVATIRRLLGESEQTRLERLVAGRPPTRWLRPKIPAS